MPFSSVVIKQDKDFADQLTVKDFALEQWQQQAETESLAGGRGASLKIYQDAEPYVLRKYMRGGWMQKLLVDRYFWTGLEQSRPFREHKVIEHALRHDLPVAAVVAYCIQQSGLFYRAAIISRYIDNQGTLAAYLSANELPAAAWSQLGVLVRKMHQAGIDHADLNANNILIDDAMNFHLIDFDKAVIKDFQTDWGMRNVERLLRSLNKIKNLRQQQGRAFNFTDTDWQGFVGGYK